MKVSIAAVVAVLALARPSPGTQWVDPSFEEMVDRADLIAVVEVVDGGKFECTVREIVLSTPADLRGYAAERIRERTKGDYQANAFRAIRDLGGKLSEEEVRILETRRPPYYDRED